MNPEAINELAILIAIILQTVLVAVGVILVLRREGPARASEYTQDRLDDLRANREVMDRLERAYQDAGRTQQRALDTVADVVRKASTYIPGELDLAVADTLDDIRTPGPESSDEVALPTMDGNRVQPADEPRG